MRFTPCPACGCQAHGQRTCGAEADGGLVSVTCPRGGPRVEEPRYDRPAGGPAGRRGHPLRDLTRAEIEAHDRRGERCAPLLRRLRGAPCGRG